MPKSVTPLVKGKKNAAPAPAKKTPSPSSTAAASTARQAPPGLALKTSISANNSPRTSAPSSPTLSGYDEPVLSMRHFDATMEQFEKFFYDSVGQLKGQLQEVATQANKLTAERDTEAARAEDLLKAQQARKAHAVAKAKGRDAEIAELSQQLAAAKAQIEARDAYAASAETYIKFSSETLNSVQFQLAAVREEMDRKSERLGKVADQNIRLIKSKKALQKELENAGADAEAEKNFLAGQLEAKTKVAGVALMQRDLAQAGRPAASAGPSSARGMLARSTGNSDIDNKVIAALQNPGGASSSKELKLKGKDREKIDAAFLAAQNESLIQTLESLAERNKALEIENKNKDVVIDLFKEKLRGAREAIEELTLVKTGVDLTNLTES